MRRDRQGPFCARVRWRAHEDDCLNYEFSGGLVLSLVLLTVVVALPMKLGAHVADAKRTGIVWCCFAAFVGLFAGLLASVIFGGLIGGPLAAAIGFAVAI